MKEIVILAHSNYILKRQSWRPIIILCQQLRGAPDTGGFLHKREALSENPQQRSNLYTNFKIK